MSDFLSPSDAWTLPLISLYLKVDGNMHKKSIKKCPSQPEGAKEVSKFLFQILSH